MRERELRFETIMKRPPGVNANRIIELEDRVRELQDEMHRAALALVNVAKRQQ